MTEKQHSILENFLLNPNHYQNIDGVFVLSDKVSEINLRNVEAFAEKWLWSHRQAGSADYENMQYKWFMQLYGFEDEPALADFLRDKNVILDAGCGYGHKANWLAGLAPHTTVIAMDLSDSVRIAQRLYGNRDNLVLVQGDIANTGLIDGLADFVLCDQVLHHTIDPAATTSELARVARPDGHLALYVYARKALPRELLDEYFLKKDHPLSKEELWDLSRRLTELGKMLDELDVSMDFPEIPQLGIKGGRTSIQRFIYENFLKCYWNPNIGLEQSVSVNFDWYSPHIAHRFSLVEFEEMTAAAGLTPLHRHSESACHSGLFRKSK